MRTMFEHYTARQAAFVAFNPEFDAGFGVAWLATIALADATPTGAVGDLKTMRLATPLAETTRLHLGLAMPKAGQLAVVSRLESEGKLFHFVTLTPEISELDVEALELGPVGQLVEVGNNGSEPVCVEVTVLG